MEKFPMTPRGFEKLKEELRWRQQNERPRIIEAVFARVSPDWIPVFSLEHARLATQMVKDGATFSSSMLCDDSTSYAIPDFVIHGQGVKGVIRGLRC